MREEPPVDPVTVTDAWIPIKADGTPNTEQVRSTQRVWQLLENFERHIKASGRVFDLLTGLRIIGYEPRWLVDERTMDILETYTFFRHAPHLAFPGSLGEQPYVWIEGRAVIEEYLARA